MEIFILIISYIFFTLFVLNITWVYFTAIMRLQLMREAGLLDVKRNKTMWYLSWFNLVIGLFLDALLNVLISVPMLELPQWQNKEILTTARLCRYYESTDTSWLTTKIRKPFATWAGEVLLNDVDPSGKHIK